jgi:hypothetical protein
MYEEINSLCSRDPLRYKLAHGHFGVVDTNYETQGGYLSTPTSLSMQSMLVKFKIFTAPFLSWRKITLPLAAHSYSPGNQERGMGAWVAELSEIQPVWASHDK